MLFPLFVISTLFFHNAFCADAKGSNSSTGAEQECGTVTPGNPSLPWHAGIYMKTVHPYQQICGGTLISTDVVLSAAHCFWRDPEKQLPTVQYAVAVGKRYRPWNDKADQAVAQKSDVKEIHLPTRYGRSSNYQDDIAVVIAASTFVYSSSVRPVCLNFDITFDDKQLQAGNKGKIAGWGLTSANGKPSQVQRVKEQSYVDIRTCFAEAPDFFKALITSDKFCAGPLQTDSAVCRGDGGGGLVFPSLENSIERYYLRGIASIAPSSEDLCNTVDNTLFSHILKHEHFIHKFWTEPK